MGSVDIELLLSIRAGKVKVRYFSSIAAGILLGLLLILAGGCRKAPEHRSPQDTATQVTASKPLFLASIAPLGSILSALAGERAEVRVLLPAGASPHAFEPRPSDAVLAQSCSGLVYVDPVLDGWAARLAAPEKIAVLDLVSPAERLPLYIAGTHQEQPDGASADSAWDPHFWTDPRIVARILPALAADLGRLDPAGADEYQRNAKAFGAELDSLDAELRAQLARYAGEPVVLFHPSMRYFLRAYNLELAAVVEAAPGKEPSPADLAELVSLVRARLIQAIFSEPQLPPQAVEAIAEAAGVKVYVLDPLGTDGNARGYQNMLRDNARTLARAFRAPAE